jgi:hypothetical protein
MALPDSVWYLVVMRRVLPNQHPARRGMEQPALLRHRRLDRGQSSRLLWPCLEGAHGARNNEPHACARQRVVSWLKRVRRFGRGAKCRSEEPWPTAAKAPLLYSSVDEPHNFLKHLKNDGLLREEVSWS